MDPCAENQPKPSENEFSTDELEFNTRIAQRATILGIPISDLREIILGEKNIQSLLLPSPTTTEERLSRGRRASEFF
jgi:DNA mismatch repair protein MutH